MSSNLTKGTKELSMKQEELSERTQADIKAFEEKHGRKPKKDEIQKKVPKLRPNIKIPNK